MRTVHWHTILNMDAVHIYLMDPIIQLQCFFILMVETFCITPLIISHSQALNASRQLILACHIYRLQLQYHKLILQHQLIKKELFLLILLIQTALVLDQDLAITYHMAPMVEVVLVGILVLMVSVIFKKGWVILILLGFWSDWRSFPDGTFSVSPSPSSAVSITLVKCSEVIWAKHHTINFGIDNVLSSFSFLSYYKHLNWCEI